MSNKSKRRMAVDDKLDKDKKYQLYEAIEIAKGVANVKFNETFELSVRLSVDPTKADQMIRGSVTLPNGTGKSRIIAVFAKGDKVTEAKEAGADFVGDADLVEKVSSGWLDFDVAVATPDMMASVGKLGKVLGPRGLMPNPKSGTVTFDVAKAIKEIQAGKVDFRVDKAGIVHAPFGKVNFEADDLFENAKALVGQLLKMKPASAKGTYIRSISISTTMGPGVNVDSFNIGLDHKSAA